MTTDTLINDDAAPESRVPLPAWTAIGVGATLVGLLPWIVNGMRLPLQYLWATETLPADMPFVALPFSQYTLTTMAGLIVTAYAVAAIVARAMRARRPRFALPVLLGTIVALHVVAIAHTAAVVRAGLTAEPASDSYVAALVAFVVFSVAVGILAFVLITRTSPVPAVVGFAGAAITFGFWLDSLVFPMGVAQETWRIQALGAAHWVPAILVGVAIAWGGISSASRVVAAVVALVLLWVIPAVATAVSSAVGSRIMLPYPAEMLEYGVGVFWQALLMPEIVVPRLLVAVVVAALGLGVRGAMRLRLRPAANQDGRDDD